MNKAVFLDRDGTLNVEVNYLSKLEDLQIIHFVSDAIKIFNQLNLIVLIISNQSAIGRNFLSENQLYNINRELIRRIKNNGALIDDLFYCPHVPSDNCDCRKPKTGLIKLAKKKYNIDVANSYIIGDNITDIELSRNCGCQGILVGTGHGHKYSHMLNSNEISVDNLLEAATIVKNKENKKHFEMKLE